MHSSVAAFTRFGWVNFWNEQPKKIIPIRWS